jgi:predicted transcriptional regulator
MNYREYLKEQMKEENFEKEWNERAAELNVMRLIASARCEQNLTQKQLAELAGIKQSNISRVENGRTSPSLSTLQSIAKGLGKTLKVDFV